MACRCTPQETLQTESVGKCDILCIQELMLTKQECMLLNSCHLEYYGYGVSPGCNIRPSLWWSWLSVEEMLICKCFNN